MDIRDSLELILTEEQPRFIKNFYAHLFAHHPKFERLFDGVDRRRQGVMVVMSLETMVNQHLRPFPAMERYFKVLGHKHYQYGVDVDDYPAFEDSLLTTFRELHGDLWSQNIEREWREACSQAVELMKEGHRDDFESE